MIILPDVGTPLTFETLSGLLRVDHLDDAWDGALNQCLTDHHDAGVELHPIHERGNTYSQNDLGLPLHNLLFRAMADNLGDAWPMVQRWMSREPTLDGRDHEELVRLWAGFWVDHNPDPLDTDGLIAGGDQQTAIDLFDRSLHLLEDLNVPHPRDVLPDEWTRVVTLSPAGRLANVGYERAILHAALDAAPSETPPPPSSTVGRARL